MSSDWSQEVSPPQPVLTWGVLIVALLFPAVVLTLVVARQWTPLQRHYLLTYAVHGAWRFQPVPPSCRELP